MRKHVLIACISLIALLFIYTATAKLIDITRFRHDMLNQPLPHWMGITAVWALPTLEILSVALMLFDRTRLTGLWIAWSMMLLFTLYTALILGNTFGRIPCSCGGFIRTLSWTQHLYFNIFFLVTASVGVFMQTQLEVLKIFHAPGTGQTENL